MEKEYFYQLLSKKERIDFSSAELESLIKEYPWFDLPKIISLLKLKERGKEEFDEKLNEFGIFFHDRKQVFKLLNTDLRNALHEKSDSPKQAVNEKSEHGALEDLLDFSYSGKVKVQEQEDKISLKENQSVEKSPDLIERFLIEEPGVIKADKKTSLSGDISQKSVQESENLLTDTLAKIYVKQGLYSKAIFAYEKLSLKYPEKSIYFASQIEEIKEITNKK